MANNSIKGRFRDLFQKVEKNLTEKSKTKLKELSQLNAKSLYDYQNNLLVLLDKEYIKILNDFAIEYKISVADIENRIMNSYIWDHYSIAIEKLNETIHTYLAEDEFNEAYAKILDPIINQSEEERDYWSELRSAINGCNEDEYTDNYEDDELDFEDNDKECSEEESRLNLLASEIEEKLSDKLTIAVKDIEEELNITGQVIAFFLEIYNNKN